MTKDLFEGSLYSFEGSLDEFIKDLQEKKALYDKEGWKNVSVEFMVETGPGGDVPFIVISGDKL